MRHTKIMCTVGPAVYDILEELILAGMDIARLNFSHGNYEQHRDSLEKVRELSYKLGKPVAIMQDLCGPKIRTGSLKGGHSVELKKGSYVIIKSEDIEGDEKVISIAYPQLYKDISPGNRIFIDDGNIELKVVDIKGSDLWCEVMVGGILTEHKGVNLPDVHLNISSITEKDKQDLLFGITHNIDLIAVSFVRSKEDILELKRIMKQYGVEIPLVAKIEKYEAVVNFQDIISEVYGIMVARGDLGVEVPLEEVPLIQKSIIRQCNEQAKPVITATQMLNSMINSPRPTRAEVTDVANAIFDGTDCVMLSGETAIGEYPLQAVEMMNKIAIKAECGLSYEEVTRRTVLTEDLTEIISLSACEMAQGFGARGIIVIPFYDNTDELIEDATRIILERKLLNKEDRVVITSGVPTHTSGTTNMLKVLSL